MANLALPLVDKPSEEPSEKTDTALICVGGACLFFWGVAGLVVTVGLLSKLFGLI